MKKEKIRHFYLAKFSSWKYEVEPIYEFTGTTKLNGPCRFIFTKVPPFINRYGILDTKTGYFIIKGLKKIDRHNFNTLAKFFSEHLPIKEKSKDIKRVSKLPKWED